MIPLESHPLGTLFSVRACPGAKKNEIKGEQDGFLKVSVTQIPEKGKANKVIIEFLAKSLKLKKSQLELLSGATSSKKRFLVREITPEELQKRLPLDE